MCIFWVNGWVTSTLLQRVVVIAHVPGIYFSRSSLHPRFCFLLLIPLSRFYWFYPLSLWLRWICNTFWGSILFSFVGPSHACWLSILAITKFSVSPWSRWGCIDQCRVVLCFFILCSILSATRQTILGLLASRKSIPFFWAVSIYHIIGRHVMG